MAAVPPVTSFPSWCVEAADQSGAGSRFPEGLFIVASSTRVRYVRSPPVPRAVPVRRLAAQEEEGRRARGRGDYEPLYRDRVCGIDIGKAGLVATIRVPSEKDPARRAAETRSF